jgi:hypothetical protein
MRRLLVCVTIASACLMSLWIAMTAWALAIRPTAPTALAAQVDAVVIGRVMALEDTDVPAPSFPGAKDKVNYRIAVVRVTEAIKGAKGKDTLRVGYVAPQPVQPARPGFVRPTLRRPSVNVAVGLQGLFYLNERADQKFYVLPAYFSFSDSQNPKYADEVKQVKKAIKLLENPIAGLKSGDAQDRLLTAGMLIGQYRTPRPGLGQGKTEPIGAEESKLILSVIADADWNRPYRFGETSPQMLFNQLGVTAKDGWTPQNFQNPQQYSTAVRDWVRQHRDTYHIQRFVHDNPAEGR